MEQFFSKKENKGVLFAGIAAALTGAFPVLIHHGTQKIPPFSFGAITVLIAMITLFIYAWKKKTLSQLKNKKTFFPIIMVGVCIVILPTIFLFWGASKTSGINTSFLLLSEMIFTLIFTHFIGEKTTLLKLAGAGSVFLGSGFILYNGTFHLNTGDILIILSTFSMPIGNFYAKKALNIVSPEILLFGRFLVGSLFLVPLALLIEPYQAVKMTIFDYWWIVLLVGVFVLGGTKIIWYEGFRRLDISKSISIGMTFPFFSLLLLILFGQERPSLYQWIGIGIISVGILLSLKRMSIDPEKTAYGKQKKTTSTSGYLDID